MPAQESKEAPNKIKDLAEVSPEGDAAAKPVVKNKGGRPKGAKNKDTLFKEMMTGRFQETAVNNIEKVYHVLFEKAHNGDMKAIKLVLDRVVPVTKAVDLADIDKKGLTINISVGDMETSSKEDIEIGEYQEIEEEMTDG